MTERKANGETEMKHFAAVEWSDFVNRLVYGDRRKAMQKHRGTRRKCYAGTAELWQKVAKAAAVESSYQPAAESVRVVKAAFAAAGWAAKRQETGGLIQLLFDSFSQPALAGARSAAMGMRQMLYRAEPYQIDIQIEAQPERNRLVVTGQLLDVSHPEIVGRDVQVSLSNRRGNVIHTVTNHFSEFLPDSLTTEHFPLTFLGRAGKPIVILLRAALDQLSRDNE